MLDKRSSLVIDAVRFPLTVLVVFIHILPGYLKDVLCDFSSESIYIFISETISHTIGRIAVPVFFVISGFFFFQGLDNSSVVEKFYSFKRKIVSRIQSVLVPYFLWNTLMIICVILKNYVFDICLGEKDDGWNEIITRSLFELYWEIPVNFPLWYIRDLIVMFALSPLFFLMIKKTGVLCLMFIYILYVMGLESGIPGLSSTAFMYFSLGAYMGLLNRDFVYDCQRLYRFMLPVCFVLVPLLTISSNCYLYENFMRLFIPIGGIVTIGAFGYLKEESLLVLKKFSGYCFFIYAIHEIYILNWTKGFFSRIVNSSSMWMIFAYFIQPIIVVSACIIIYRLLKYYWPGLLSILVGGRIKK